MNYLWIILCEPVIVKEGLTIDKGRGGRRGLFFATTMDSQGWCSNERAAVRTKAVKVIVSKTWSGKWIVD